ncbi:hypothetical protein [Clostridium aminobutyricum]|uniref:Uncharacterized protein n=1 Tax=Clostridium aminobutyricum TaxID=33953 RepID=A0A939IFT0_CLOAM|nr:hypothetical protein [Clostridium aminobutyricum]MBN7771850.1 hypothetical protein [Clostridium aminobutyricum]
MVRMTSFILSLAFLVMGFLGLTELLPIFKTYPVYANVGAIALGVLGLLIVLYVRRIGESAHQRRENSQQKKENVQLRKETYDQSKREIEQLKKDIEQLKAENMQQRIMIEQHALQSNSETW